MNYCPIPELTDLRCWLCPHNPYPRELSILGVHAILKPDEAKRVRLPCWEDDQVFRDFNVIAILPGELDADLIADLKEIGLNAQKIAMNTATSEILYAFSPIVAEEKSSATVEDEEKEDWPEDDEDDWDDEDNWNDDPVAHCPDSACNSFENEEEDYDDPTDYLPHLNRTLESALMPEITHVGDSLDDLLELIFDLYKVFPDRKDVISDMEDLVCDMMDKHDDLLQLAETYNYECEED